MSRATVVLILLSAMMAGCGARPVETIRDSGDFRFERGNFAGAAEEYTEITERYPGDWEAHYRLGLCQLELQRLDEARRALEIARTQRPRDTRIADALAESMFQQGDEAALFAFLKGRAEADQTVEAYLRMARYAVAMGDPDSAQVAFETAIVLDDGRSVEPYLEAAAFAERLGDMDEALRRLRQAYGIEPLDERVNQRLRDLGEVPGPTFALPPGK
ncbi:MAG: tetratricopeptide repeat protein [Planctomycetota bacterium]|jgi:tetratricopeptide (TPR) repeat protein